VQQLPTHIVVTCPECGHDNVFRQPYPYHAGLADQGFLYSEKGHCTLSWSSFDPDYVGIAGRQHPWMLSPADRERLEARLSPAPDGTRWLFRNPARCLRCGHPISGPISETICYLRYDRAEDRDPRYGGRAGLKGMLKPDRTAVPWSTREVWLAVVAAAVILAAAYGFAFLLRALLVRPNADFWVALFPVLLELLFLAPVWWFVRHKHRASVKTLGFVKFNFSVVAIGLGLLLAFYLFSAIYGFILAQFGLEIRSDVTPILRELTTPWPFFLTVTIVAPVVEETFFRGFVFAGLRARYHWAWAAVMSSALFAAAHLELTFFIPAFLLGFLFAFLYQKSNSVWPGMILHFVLNALAVVALYVQL
jgi:uncharacterized protein